MYVYQLRMGGHTQTGLAACFSLDDYDRDVIKKHERTRRDKEDDRTRHMIALGAQTGPVFLTYRAQAEVNDVVRHAGGARAAHRFRGRRRRAPHDLVRRRRRSRRARGGGCADPRALHRRRPSPRGERARARGEMRERGLTGTALGDGADASTFLAVAFPHDQVQILPYNRAVKDLGGLSPGAFMNAIRERFDVQPGPASPAARGDIAM